MKQRLGGLPALHRKGPPEIRAGAGDVEGVGDPQRVGFDRVHAADGDSPMTTQSHAAATVMIVDDHEIVRDAIAALLEASGRFTIVSRLNRGDDAPEIARRLRPAIALLDIEMPGRSSFDTARSILAISPSTKVVFLTGYAHGRYAREAAQLGASAFLLKSDSSDRIIASLDRVMSGKPTVSALAVEDGTGAPSLGLTPRELEVLKYIARGMSTKDMAETMCLSPRTVERHIERLMARLGIRDRLNLAIFAFKEGLADAVATPDEAKHQESTSS